MTSVCQIHFVLYLQCLFRTAFHTFKTKNTFGTVFTFSGIICHINIHWANMPALVTTYTLILVHLHPHERKITHWLQKNRNRTYVLAEGSVILQQKCQSYSHHIVKNISYQEAEEHNPFEIANLQQKQGAYKD